MVKKLERSEYIIFGPQYQVLEIYCKVCGNMLAGLVGEGYQRRFFYFPEYVEFKFSCDDGSQHITNLCFSCMVAIRDDVEMLQLVHDADVEVMARTVPKLRDIYGKRKAVKFESVDLKTRKTT